LTIDTIDLDIMLAPSTYTQGCQSPEVSIAELNL
jgi:hypothetical protein